MTKNQLLGILALGLALSPLTASRAQETPLRTAPEAVQERVAERVATRKERLTNISQRIIERLTKLSNRFDETIARLSTHIKRKTADGTDLTAAQTKVDEAAKLNAEVKSALAALIPKVATALSATELKTSFQTLRPELEKIRTNLRTVHTTLMEAIKLVRATGTTN